MASSSNINNSSSNGKTLSGTKRSPAENSSPENDTAGQKEYFLKSPEGFLFTHLFASNAIQERLNEELKDDVSLTPVSFQFASSNRIKNKAKYVTAIVRFPEEFPGTAVTYFPENYLRKTVKKPGGGYGEIVKRIYEPVGLNLSQIFDVKNGKVEIDSDVEMIKKFFPENEKKFLWIKYHIEIPGKTGFFALQCISYELLSTLSHYYLKKDLDSKISSSVDLFLSFVRSINKKFQERLIHAIASDEDHPGIALRDTKPGAGASVGINLEELRLVDDRALRAILDEISRRRLPPKSVVYALSGMSEELRGRFLQNMSRNRRSEIREGLSLWEGTPEEILQEQRELAWIIIDLTESGGIKVNKRFQGQLEAIIRSMDAALRKSAEDFIKSNTFTESIKAVNDILLQVLIRRVPRKVLIHSLAYQNDMISKKIGENMTPFSLQLLNEDITQWLKNTKDETEKLTACAAAQRTVMRTAVKIKKEFSRAAF